MKKYGILFLTIILYACVKQTDISELENEVPPSGNHLISEQNIGEKSKESIWFLKNLNSPVALVYSDGAAVIKTYGSNSTELVAKDEPLSISSLSDALGVDAVVNLSYNSATKKGGILLFFDDPPILGQKEKYDLTTGLNSTNSSMGTISSFYPVDVEAVKFDGSNLIFVYGIADGRVSVLKLEYDVSTSTGFKNPLLFNPVENSNLGTLNISDFEIMQNIGSVQFVLLYNEPETSIYYTYNCYYTSIGNELSSLQRGANTIGETKLDDNFKGIKALCMYLDSDNGDIYIAGYNPNNYINDDNWYAPKLYKYNIATGQLLYSNQYTISDNVGNYTFSGLTKVGDKIYACGGAHNFVSGNFALFGYGLLAKIDANSGQMIEHHTFGNSKFNSSFNSVDYAVDENAFYLGGYEGQYFSENTFPENTQSLIPIPVGYFKSWFAKIKKF